MNCRASFSFSRSRASQAERLAAWPTVLRPSDGGFTIDRHLLEDMRPGSKLTLALSETEVIELVVERVERQSAVRYVLSGAVTSTGGGWFAIAVEDQAVAGSIRSVFGPRYRIRSPDASWTEVREISANEKPDCAVDEVTDSSFPSPSIPMLQSEPVDDGSEIDVLVVYTPAARASEGGSAAIAALIELGVSEANQALAGSEAAPRIRLVGAEEVDYIETLDSRSDLTALRDGTGGLERGPRAPRRSLR